MIDISTTLSLSLHVCLCLSAQVTLVRGCCPQRLPGACSPPLPRPASWRPSSTSTTRVRPVCVCVQVFVCGVGVWSLNCFTLCVTHHLYIIKIAKMRSIKGVPFGLVRRRIITTSTSVYMYMRV